MLRTPTPYPQVGSFALLVDVNLPVGQQRVELVRVMRLGVSTAAVAFPLRAGATGNTTVALADLIDGTPLTAAEEAVAERLEASLRGVRAKAGVRGTSSRASRPSPARAARYHALRERGNWSLVMSAELAKLEAREAREARRAGASPGFRVPQEWGA